MALSDPIWQSDTRKAAEANLLAALKKADEYDEKHRFLFENMTQGVVYHAKDRRVIYANKAAGQILGLTIDQLKGKTSMDSRWRSICEDGSDYPGNKHPAMITFETGRPVKNERMGIYIPDDEVYRWININSLPIFRNGDENRDQVLVTFEDITEVVNTKNKLKKVIIEVEESEEKYRNLVETAQELIWKCDQKGRFIYLNKAWETSHGYKVEEMLGKSFGEFQEQEIFQRDMSEFAKHLAGGFVKGYETTHLAKDGKELTLLFNAIPVFNEIGDIVGTQGTATDITQRKKHEEELEKYQDHLEMLVKERTDELEASNEELKTTNEELNTQKDELELAIKKLNETQLQLVQSEKMASLGVLVAGVAHEINNPVNFINSSLSGLKNNLNYLLSFAYLYNQLLENDSSVIKEIRAKQKEASLADVLEMFN